MTLSSNSSGISSKSGAIQIFPLHSKGKRPHVDTPTLVAEHEFEPLAVELDHGVAAGALPAHHRDPFDRVLIAPAQRESLVVVTDDSAFAGYDVETVRASR